MKRLLTFLNKYMEETILVFGITVMILAIFFQVVTRYFFNYSLAWSEELARYIFIWQVWLAVPYAVIKGRHIRLDLLPDIVGSTDKFVLHMIFFAVSVGFFAFLSWQSISVVKGVMAMNQLTPVIHIPKWICYLSVPVGSLLAVLRFIQYGALRVMRFIKDPNDSALFVLDAEDKELIEEGSC